MNLPSHIAVGGKHDRNAIARVSLRIAGSTGNHTPRWCVWPVCPWGSMSARYELLNLLPVAIYMTDAEGRIILSNSRAESLFGSVEAAIP